MYIFDLDGTITDTNGIWPEVDLEFLARRGLPHTQEYQRVVERSIYPIAAGSPRTTTVCPNPRRRSWRSGTRWRTATTGSWPP